jgi:predicted small integral membrane protein
MASSVLIDSTVVRKSILSESLFQVNYVLIVVETLLRGSEWLSGILSEIFKLFRTLLWVSQS